MNYDDQFLYKLIKRLHELVLSLQAQIGMGGSGGGTNVDYIIELPTWGALPTDNPPPDPTKIYFATYTDDSPSRFWLPTLTPPQWK